MGQTETAGHDGEGDGGGDGDGRVTRLAVLKALGDNTRYAIYLELARAPVPRSTSEIAETLGLHPNTVRPHLERMRDVGLLEVAAAARGTVGRPQHRYSLAPDAPSLGLEAPAFPLLARMLVGVASAARVEAAEALDVARDHGRVLAAAARPSTASCSDALVTALDGLGFDPASASDGRSTTIAFTHCPYRELAEANPDLVCSLHRGLIEGFVAEAGGAEVERFGTLVDREPCQVQVSVG